MPASTLTHRLYGLALEVYGRLPRFLRLWVIRRIAPAHTVGSLCLIEHDGRLLLLRQRHRLGWTLPGGLVNRGESAAAAAEREVIEETGLRVQVGQPFATVVDPDPRRVDVLFWIPADQEYPVRAAGEAVSASWLRPQDAGQLDEPTAQALAEFSRYRSDPLAAHAGRLIGRA